MMRLLATVLLGDTSSCHLEYCTGQCSAGGNDGSCPCFRQRRADVKAAFCSHIAAEKPPDPDASIYTTCWRSGNSREPRDSTIPGHIQPYVHAQNAGSRQYWRYAPKLWRVILHRSILLCPEAARQAKACGHLPVIRSTQLTASTLGQPATYRYITFHLTQSIILKSQGHV